MSCNHKTRSRQRIGGSIKTMGVSMSEDKYDLLKKYALVTNTSVSKILVDAVDFVSLSRLIDLEEQLNNV